MANVVHTREERKKKSHNLNQAPQRPKGNNKNIQKLQPVLRQTQHRLHFNICHALMQFHSPTEDLKKAAAMDKV